MLLDENVNPLPTKLFNLNVYPLLNFLICLIWDQTFANVANVDV